MTVRSIIRRDLVRELEQLVGPGLDISETDAARLVAAGQAQWGPEHEPPAAVYLLCDIEIRGFTYATGTMLHIGREISEPEAVLLIRGRIGEPGGGVASAPGGGIG